MTARILLWSSSYYTYNTKMASRPYCVMYSNFNNVLNSESMESLPLGISPVPNPHHLGSKTNIFQKLLRARHSYRTLAALTQKQERKK